MCRKGLALIISALFVVSIIGCGFQNLLPSKEVPPLGGYNTVVIAPYGFKKPTQKFVDYPTMVSYGIGTKLSVRFQDKKWFFDQSQQVKPVSDKLKELNIKPEDLYQDPQAVTKLAEAFQADLVIVGQMGEPEFTKEESGKIEEDKTKVSGTGAARYYTIFQTAILRTDVKVIDVKAKNMIWNGRLISYKKYATKYLTGNPPKLEREETMLADLRKDYAEKITAKLYPAKR